jgi:putative GTP pyrophosphokinase
VSADQSLSRAAVDQLGDRLRGGVTEEDLRLLDRYRRSFRPDYEQVVDAIRAATGAEVSGRPAKSTTAIVDKLRRSSMRLSQMQDIAGCRTIVADTLQQDKVVEIIKGLFDCQVSDRRVQPSHGYRAVHVIARPNRVPIEIQVRTRLQHLWAELSEKFADRFGIEVKYGGGDAQLQENLQKAGDLIRTQEATEVQVQSWSESIPKLESAFDVLRAKVGTLKNEEVSRAIDSFAEVVAAQRGKLVDMQSRVTEIRLQIQQILIEMSDAAEGTK